MRTCWMREHGVLEDNRTLEGAKGLAKSWDIKVEIIVHV